MRNETAFAQLADAADQSQSKLRAAAQEMQHASERMRQDMASLNQQTESLQNQVGDVSSGVFVDNIRRYTWIWSVILKKWLES